MATEARKEGVNDWENAFRVDVFSFTSLLPRRAFLYIPSLSSLLRLYCFATKSFPNHILRTQTVLKQKKVFDLKKEKILL